MSVCTFSASELATLLRSYRAIRPTLGHSAPEPLELSIALFYAHLANMAAYQASYQDWIDSARTAEAQQAIDQALTGRVTFRGTRNQLARTFIRDVRLLQYNCLSNGGGDFLPARARDVLERAMTAMLDELADVYGESTTHDQAA